ncbi:hypothetical protein [Subtercola vilae]|uniref:ABC transporter ATP-binding protein n=1 Tax=Subtercola vilae TaxID=2056433 RepID=A0A4T2C3X7_9MICO|nr:hypothetical protein [Subtercola vilae]TIH38720.1 hypothetical protein D4765_06410 [Subtercola vilae]
MKVILSAVSKGENGQNLPETSLSYESGRVTLAVVETAQRPTLLALMATGRMAPDAGTITFEREPDSEALRASTTIVDAPDVSEHVGDLKLTAVVQEELMFAGLPSGRAATLRAIDELDATEYATWQLTNIPAAVRLHVLGELAAARPGIRGLVLTTPDRHGGDPAEWWPTAAEFARRGLAVLLIVSRATADGLRGEVEALESERLAALAAAAEEQRLAELARLAELEAESAALAAEPAPVSASPTADTASTAAPESKERA